MADKDYDKLRLDIFNMKSMVHNATVLLLGRRRSGKCKKVDTPVLMFDGSIKMVQDIQLGELVMGDDSTPRTVLETHNGRDIMYEVMNKKGLSYTVNSHHILSLMYTAKKNIRDRKGKHSYQITWFNNQTYKLDYKSFSYKDKNLDEKELIHKEALKFLDDLVDNRICDIPILDFLKLSKKYQDNLLGYQVPVDFPEKTLVIDPYFIGYLLGITASNSNITTLDSAVIHYFNKNLGQYKLFLDCFDKNRYENNNIFLNTLKDLNLINNKHIPMIYKCNSRENRIKLLAGFIDADGHLKETNGFEICQSKEHEVLLDDIIYLARSLGFSCYKHIKKTSWVSNGVKKFGEAFRIHINGKGIDEIPTVIPRKQAKPRADRVNALVSQIKITKMPEDKYYGIELDGNNRYILGNFIVTHNSWLVRDIFYHHKEVPWGLIFSGTEEANPFFGDFIPSSFIHEEFDPSLIDTLLLKQSKKVKKAREKGIKDGLLPQNRAFVVLDDMLADSAWAKDKTIKTIFFNGRHYNLFFILTMQYPLGIPPALRSNIDYVFVFNEPSIKNRKKIYDDYGGCISSFDHFCNILDSCTTDHKCLVIKTSGNSNELKDQIFWYKAQKHENFKVGHKLFWEYHNLHYNSKHDQEKNEEQEEIEKLKLKYGKTNKKKLKIIVSRTGDVIKAIEQTD